MTEQRSNHETGIIRRPHTILDNLSPEFRWEYTRRHPYYIRYWRAARHDNLGPNPSEQEWLEHQIALTILLWIGVTDYPPSPDTSASSLESGVLENAWIDGAIAPITVRSLITMLILLLSSEDRRRLGHLLTEAPPDLADEVQMRYRAAARFLEIQHTFPNVIAPASFNFRPEASQRSILSAVERLVQEYKREHCIPEHRRQDDKHPGYLAVWDLREGWNNGYYDPTAERTFEQISTELNVPLPTVASRYQAAFRYITGQPYQPELWDRIFGLARLTMLTSRLPGQLFSRRPRHTRRRRPTPFSILLPQRPGSSDPQIPIPVISQDDMDMELLLVDIRELISRNYTNAEIIEELGLTSREAPAALDYLRQRGGEM